MLFRKKRMKTESKSDLRRQHTHIPHRGRVSCLKFFHFLFLCVCVYKVWWNLMQRGDMMIFRHETHSRCGMCICCRQRCLIDCVFYSTLFFFFLFFYYILLCPFSLTYNELYTCVCGFFSLSPYSSLSQ